MTISPQIAPYGAWKSPITADLIVASSINLTQVCWDGQDIYWLEGRPSEGGRNVLVKQSADGEISDITPDSYNVRTRVHEYGGGAFLVHQGTVFFSNDRDRALYRQGASQTPEKLTQTSDRAYADFVFDAQRQRLIAVCEDQSGQDKEPQNYLITIDLVTGQEMPLSQGWDFYAAPRLSPDGNTLVWLAWNHPNLPWDGTYLWRSQISPDGSLLEPELVAGGDNESIAEPQWSPDGLLYYVSDRKGWWNLYRQEGDQVRLLYPLEAEFTYPQWIFGLSSYTFASADEIICTYSQGGRWYLARLLIRDRELIPLALPYTEIASLHSNGQEIIFIGSTPTESTAIVRFNLETAQIQPLKRASTLIVPADYLCVPEAIAFPTANGLTAYAWYYPPQNGDYQPPDGELPPLLVKSHGGPTAAAHAGLSLRVQYWTSRGFAYLDVNYGGSTGFGRAYRQRLDKNWGIVDVDDCVNAAQYLVAQGKVDGDRLAISGGSAGGYTTLAALTFRDTFKAGASYYGVSDLIALASDTHKFESRYLDRLIGPYPEAKAIYDGRSPLYSLDSLTCPLIFFQGLEDRVVPPSQAELMVTAIDAKGLPVAYVPFEGEQHGFRRAENIKRAIEAEFYFYSRIFGFHPADAIAPIHILNLKT
jgi:dipeptidyl aminopeptidase/acylaminoacyl peptidase